MNTDSPLNKKDILSDPVAIYFTIHSDASPIIKSQLEDLWKKNTDLKQSIKKNKTKSKKLSRQIGEAKRNNDNMEPYLLTMQATSRALKQQTLLQNETENEIIRFFELDEAQQETKTTHDVERSPASRITTDKNIDLKHVFVKTLTVEHDAWNDYVIGHPAGCIHHHSSWSTLLNQSYGHDSHFLFACDDKNTIVGVLPLVRLKSRLFGDMLVSMPFFQRGGAIADHPLIEQLLMKNANKYAAKLNVEHIEYRDVIKRENMPVQTHKVNMVLSLASSSDELWHTFSSKLRAQIRRPQRENTSIVIGHKELLNDFYSVYTRNMRDLGSPPHSKKFIGKILDQFHDNSWLIVIYLNDKPVAGGFLLGQNKTLEIPLASTIRDVNALSINMLLYWEVLQFAIKKGYKEFDFGRSSIDAGTYNFKKQWGAKPKPLYWHYWLGNTTEIPSINPSNPKYQLVISIWKRLPVALTTMIGPWLVKNIP